MKQHDSQTGKLQSGKNREASVRAGRGHVFSSRGGLRGSVTQLRSGSVRRRAAQSVVVRTPQIRVDGRRDERSTARHVTSSHVPYHSPRVGRNCETTDGTGELSSSHRLQRLPIKREGTPYCQEHRTPPTKTVVTCAIYCMQFVAGVLK